jgi:uncharacterized protein (DUF924 family)
VNPKDVHRFWFGAADDWAACVSQNSERWFVNGQQLDTPVREQFGPLIEIAERGELDHWMDSPRSAMSLILVLDQFPRHVHRGDARAFGFDHKALQMCLHGIDQGIHEQLSAVERTFYYLPMEHVEDLQIQQRCIALMQENARSAAPELQAFAENALHYSEMHCEIIAQFGHFPHRNELLGRVPTAQETAYLEGGGHRFGQ